MSSGDDEYGERLARIEEKVDNVVEMLERQNGRLGRAESDITTRRVRDGYIAGTAAALAAVTTWLVTWLTGGTR